MQKVIRIEILWSWDDWICSKRRYGVRVQSLWIGISFKMSKKDIESHTRLMSEWVDSLR